MISIENNILLSKLYHSQKLNKIRNSRKLKKFDKNDTPEHSRQNLKTLS